MKKIFSLILLISQFALLSKTFSQNIAINAFGSLPDTSAMLDVSSTTKGFLAPRMTTTQQNAIPLPALGLLIFNTSENAFKVNTGTTNSPVWTPLAFNSGSGLTSLNALTGATQTFAAGTANSDFNISSSGTVHTFNLPSASATNRGALSSTDWTLFNNKQAAIVSPNTASKYWTGYKTFGSLFDSVRAAISITTTGTSGSATYNSTTGVINIPQYTAGVSGGSSAGWSLVGNSSTNPASNYIGTNDANALVFKVSGVQAGYLGHTYTLSTSFGYGSNAAYGSTAIGYNSQATGLNYSTAIGYAAKASTQDAVAIGDNAQAKGGNNAIAVGLNSVGGYTDAIAIGTAAQASASTNYNETIAIGHNSIANSSQGIAIGTNATTVKNGSNNSDGSIAIGVGAKASAYQSTAFGNGTVASGDNSTAIGNGATASIANSISIGNSLVTSIRGQVSFNVYSDGRFKRNIRADVPGLDFILKLRPVTYNWDIHKFNAHKISGETVVLPAKYSLQNEEEEAAIREKESIHYTGFIAQEVEQAAQAINYNFSGVLKPQDDKDAYSLSYSEFVVPLVKATQELNKQNEILNKKLEVQQKMIEQLVLEVKLLKKKK